MIPRALRLVSLCPLLVLAVAAPAWAQAPLPVGTELLVNEFTTGAQIRPQVADTGSGFVVVWQDADAGCGLSGTLPCVEARRFDDSSTPLGGEFQLSSTTSTNQTSPTVSASASGSFVAAWSEGLNVSVRRFDSAGVALGPEQSAAELAQLTGPPAIGVDAVGRFVVAWDSDGGMPTDEDVRIRRFDSAGVALGASFLANAYTSDSQLDPDVFVRSDGAFVAVWSSVGCTACPDTDAESIRAARFDSSAAGLGDFLVNSYTTGSQANPAITGLPGNGFVVAWNDRGLAARAQRFDSVGTALGAEIVASDTSSIVAGVTVSAGTSGDFVVSWSADALTRNDSDPPSIEAQAYASSGDALGGIFQVNVLETGAQQAPDIAHLGDDFVVVWDTDALADPQDISVAAFIPAVPPEIFLVTKTADTADGVCDADCSLREAIVAANANEPSTDLIRIPAGTYVLTRAGSDDNAFAGDLDITDNVTLEVIAGARGTGDLVAIIDGNGVDDVFDVDALATGLVEVTMNDLVITGGVSGSGGGGLDNAGILILNRCRVTGNQAGAEGGGILNEGTLTLVDTLVDTNQAGSGGGGGISNEGALTLLRSTVSGNVTAGSGGGVLHLDTGFVLQVVNSTVSGNTANAVIAGGGGLALLGDTVLLHSTIANNTAVGGSTAVGIFGGGSPVVSVTNSILAGSCNNDSLLSGGGNIESPGDTCIDVVGTGDQLGISASALRLGALSGANGGATPTHLPLPGSAAIDVAAADAGCLAADQREVARPQDGDGNETATCDVGAVEALTDEGVEIFGDDFETGDFSQWSSFSP